MFAVNRKSLGEFKVNPFYLAQFSISTLPENVSRECRNEKWARVS